MAVDRDDKQEDKGDEAVEGVIDFFTERGDEDSPTSDADAPPPG